MSGPDLTGAIDAATKAVLTMTSSTQPDGSPAPWSSHQSHNYNASCIVCRGDVRAIIEAAVPVLLAAERERIAQQILRAASTLPADALSARGHAEWAAAIARGSVAGKQASSNVD